MRDHNWFSDLDGLARQQKCGDSSDRSRDGWEGIRTAVPVVYNTG